MVDRERPVFKAKGMHERAVTVLMMASDDVALAENASMAAMEPPASVT